MLDEENRKNGCRLKTTGILPETRCRGENSPGIFDKKNRFRFLG